MSTQILQLAEKANLILLGDGPNEEGEYHIHPSADIEEVIYFANLLIHEFNKLSVYNEA